MSGQDLKNDLDLLFSVYAYKQAQRLLQTKKHQLPRDFETLLGLLVQRFQLRIEGLFDQELISHFREAYAFDLIANPYEEELLANYMMVLESQLKLGDTIDFVRAVSPIIYRLFLRLALQVEPDLLTYLHNAKDDRYDTWYLKEMSQSGSSLLTKFASATGDRRVTSKSLQDLILLSDLPEPIKDLVKDLRRFEKSVRNPLAHLIKPFDEEELYRTTRFSSKDFLAKIISLAQHTGIAYDSDVFYFDKANAVLNSLLK